MKKSLISILGALAVFAGCTKENENYGFIVPEGKELVKIIATAEQSRTTVDINDLGANYAWNFSDTLAVVEEDADCPSKFTLVDAATGTFAGVKTEGKSLVFAITPEAFVTSGVDAGGTLQEFSVSLPDFYFDYVPGTTNAVMFGTPAEATDNGYRFYFRHAAAVIKVRYENVPKGTAGLCLTTDKVITGSWFFDSLDDVVLTTTSQGSNSVYLMLEKPVSLPNQSLDFYVPVPVGEYGSLSITLVDENMEELPETARNKEKVFSLERGDLFTTPVVTLPEESLAGSYIIVSKAATKGNWVVMQTSTGGSNNDYWIATESEISYDKDVNLLDSSIDFPQFSNNNYRFEVEALDEGGYVLRNTLTGKYIQYKGSGNSGKEVESEEKAAFDIFKINSDGSWTIGTVTESDTYSIEYNSGASPKRFTFYKGTMQAIYLIPYVGAATPVVLSGSCKNNVVTLTAVPSNAEIWYTVDGSEPDGTTPMTRYEEPFEITEDLTLKAIAYAPDETYTDSDVFVLECTYIDPSTTAYYEKVTKAPVDWSGEYLLVCENQNLALSSISSTSTKYGIGAEVSISNEQILSDPTTNAYKVVIAGATDNGDGYTLMLSDIYLAWTSGNSLTTANSESDNSRWTISAGATSGNWIIANVAQSSREIWYNTGSPRFACYENKAESTTGYAPIQLYKLSDSRQKLPTPEGLQMEEDFTVSWTPVDGAASYNVVIGTLHDNTTESSYTFEGEAGYYNVSVIAVSGDGQYADSDPAILENAKFGTPTLPAPELSKGACTGTSVQVTWTADERATNGYQATLYVPGAPALDSQVVTEGSVTFDGLNAETTYTVQVYALAVEEGEFPYAESKVSSIEVSTTDDTGEINLAYIIAHCGQDFSIEGITVMAVSGSNVILSDDSALMLLYKNGHGVTKGDVISISGSTKFYNGVAEFYQDGNSSELTITKTGTTSVDYGTPTVLDAQNMSGEWASANSEVVYVTGTGVQGSDGKTITINGAGKLYLDTANASTNGKNVTVFGYIHGWNTNHENFNFLATSIVNNDPTLEVTPLVKTWAYNETTAADFKVTALNGTWDYAITSPSLSWASIERTNTGLTITPKGENGSDYDYSGTVTVTLTPSNGGDELTKDIVLTQTKNKGGGEPTEEEITTGTFSGDKSSISMTTASGITITQLKNSGTDVNLNYNTVSTLRVYRANQLSFTGQTFTKIEMYYTGSYSGADWSVAEGNGTVSIDVTNKKVVWENASGSSTVTLQNSTASGTNTQLRTTKFVVTY